MSRNGVITLEKWVEEGLTAEPAVVYEVSCTTEQATRVRLRDGIPGPFEAEDIGFSASYHGDRWRIEGDEIRFESLVDPESPVRTLFGVDTSDASALSAFLSEPTVEIASGGPGDEDWGVLSADLVDVTTGDDAGSSDRPADETVRQFLEEFDGGSLTDTQQREIRSALGLDDVASVAARVEHCQRQLSGLSAYVDALEGFLDEQGDGRQLVESFRADVEAVESRLAGLADDIDATTAEQAATRARVAELETTVEDLDGLGDEVVTLASQLEETTVELQTEIDDVRRSVEELQEWQEGVVAAFEGLDGIEEP